MTMLRRGVPFPGGFKRVLSSGWLFPSLLVVTLSGGFYRWFLTALCSVDTFVQKVIPCPEQKVSLRPIPGMSGMFRTLHIRPFPTSLRLVLPCRYPIVHSFFPGESGELCADSPFSRQTLEVLRGLVSPHPWVSPVLSPGLSLPLTDEQRSSAGSADTGWSIPWCTREDAVYQVGGTRAYTRREVPGHIPGRRIPTGVPGFNLS